MDRLSHDRRAPALLALRRRRVRLDRRARWRRCGATSCRPISQPRWPRRASTACWPCRRARRSRRRAGCSSSPTAPVHRRRGRLGRPAGRRRGRASSSGVARTRSSSASATSCRASRTSFLARPAFRRGIAGLERLGLAYDILVYRAAAAGGGRASRARFPRQRFVLDHLAKPDIRGGGIAAWGRDLGALAALPERMLQALGPGDRSGLARVDAGAAAPVPRRRVRRLRAGAADDRIGLAGLHGGRRRTGASSVLVRTRSADCSADEQRAVLGGNAAATSGTSSRDPLRRKHEHDETMRRSRASALAGGPRRAAAQPAAPARSAAPRRRAHDRGHPQGHHARVLEEHPRRRREGRRRSWASTIIWRGPLREDDRDAQVTEVEGFVSRGVSGIVLAPLDETRARAPGGRTRSSRRSRS